MWLAVTSSKFGTVSLTDATGRCFAVHGSSREGALCAEHPGHDRNARDCERHRV